jgi:hypothetical protein
MIGQMSSMMPLVGAERVQRSPVTGEEPGGNNDLLSGVPVGGDSTSLSPAALAMAKNVPPAGESVEQRGTRPDESENTAEKKSEKKIDIRV